MGWFKRGAVVYISIFLIITTVSSVLIFSVLLGNPLYPKELGNICNSRNTVVMTMLIASTQMIFPAHHM